MNILVVLLWMSGVVVGVVWLFVRKEKGGEKNVPPGSFGWPVVGETLAFLRANKEGRPEAFVHERMRKYGRPAVFKTSLLGEKMAVFCGPPGNKLLFCNEGKLVALWWPPSIQKLAGFGLLNMVGEEARATRKMLMSFLGPDKLVTYITTMDKLTLHHIASHWEGKEELRVYPAVKVHTFELVCRVFMSIEDSQVMSKLGVEFDTFLKGLLVLPINIPGTRFYRGMRAAEAIRKMLRVIIRDRRMALQHSKSSSISQDLLSHLLLNCDENGNFMTETEIINNIIALLFASHDTTTSTIVLIIKYLAQLPQVYQNVLKEQTTIAASKEGELLKWEDIQKMRYSWNFISEVIRVSPPVSGSFREAIVDFTFEGYTIPKGWKLYWSAASTHKDPNIFPETTRFDPSRFEGNGPAPFSYVPFGGGPRMCLGKEFGRVELLVFLHNIINKFKWKLQIPDEKIINDPLSVPVHGLPIHLRPLHSTLPF